jgi:hypothetical protein
MIFFPPGADPSNPQACTDTMEPIACRRSGGVEKIDRAALRPASEPADLVYSNGLSIDGGRILYPGFPAGV